jgi:hypothetical protein
MDRIIYSSLSHQITPDTTILQHYTMLLIVHLGHRIPKCHAWDFYGTSSQDCVIGFNLDKMSTQGGEK